MFCSSNPWALEVHVFLGALEVHITFILRSVISRGYHRKIMYTACSYRCRGWITGSNDHRLRTALLNVRSFDSISKVIAALVMASASDACFCFFDWFSKWRNAGMLSLSRYFPEVIIHAQHRSFGDEYFSPGFVCNSLTTLSKSSSTMYLLAFGRGWLKVVFFFWLDSPPLDSDVDFPSHHNIILSLFLLHIF